MNPTPAKSLKNPVALANPGFLRSAIWVWSLINIGLALLTLLLPWTWAFGDKLAGVDLSSLIAVVSEGVGPYTMLATLLVWALCGLGWYMLVRGRTPNSPMLQWLCILFVVLAAVCAILAGIEPPGDVSAFVLILGALSAGGYLLASAERLLLGRLFNAGPISPYLWGVGAIGFFLFMATAARGYGGPSVRILIGFRLFSLIWPSCWFAEFAAAILGRVSRQA